MRRIISMVGVGLVSLLVAASSHAQEPAAGDLDPQGHVFVKIYVTILQPGTYGRPIPGVTLYAVTSNNRIALQTDAAGVATAWLSPGNDRLIVASPVAWQGRAFSWDVPLIVRPGMSIIELTQRNADAVTEAIQERTDTLTPTPAAVAPPARVTSEVAGSRKDPALATVLSFLVPGVGQMYAGSPGKGVAFLLADLTGVGLVIAGIECNAHGSCAGPDQTCISQRAIDAFGNPYTYFDCGTAGASNKGNPLLYTGIALGLVNGIWSMFDAHSTAEHYNRQHGLASAIRNARPLVAIGPRGETRLGVSF